MLDSPSATERLQAVQAFYAFPEWGLPLIRKSLDEGGIGIEPWRAVMLLGMIGEQKDISRILGIIQNNPQLPRPEVWEGAMERLYWKYRMPPKTALKIKELNLKKTRNTELKEGFQLSAASIEFQLQNPSQPTSTLAVTLYLDPQANPKSTQRNLCTLTDGCQEPPVLRTSGCLLVPRAKNLRLPISGSVRRKNS